MAPRRMVTMIMGGLVQVPHAKDAKGAKDWDFLANLADFA